MSLLTLSTNQITFEPSDTFKNVQMINVGGNEQNRRPIMYKIKTNKIDYVDAKPSCGYISGLKGQNQINVMIRSLTLKKEYTAKLQILYVSHEKITQEIVQRSKKHFDMIEYNELYDSIKQGNQSDVKSAIINVTRKGIDPNQQAPVDQHSESRNRVKMAEVSQSIKDKTMNKFDTIPMQKKKGSSKGSLILLIIGVLVGFLLGAKYGGDLGLFDNNQIEGRQAGALQEEDQGIIVSKVSNSIEAEQGLRQKFRQQAMQGEGVDGVLQRDQEQQQSNRQINDNPLRTVSQEADQAQQAQAYIDGQSEQQQTQQQEIVDQQQQEQYYEQQQQQQQSVIITLSEQDAL